MNFIRKNKWLCAFIATAVLLVAAIIVAICLGVGSGADAPTPPYTEGDEIGVYYYDVADGEILLTLSGGNNFTLAGPQINKTGTYSVDEEGNILLDFVRDEDNTATATIDGNNVVLVYNDATMTFLKKINFTVSFNANGGSEVTAATVVNGKNTVKPADPTKNGYAFLGWYTDAELKNVYDFASATVTADLTLYARWVEDKVGAGKYTVSFDLGYEGATGYDPIETISGLAYNVPTPERTGYTFGGWWISMYGDASKLSYKYAETTVFNANTTLYAVWYEAASAKLVAPLASVNGNTISWDSVTGASKYTVTITDANGEVVHTWDGGTTTINYDFAGKDAGDYTISVVAVSTNEASTSDAAVSYYANKALAKVSQFQVIDGILIYNAVPGATNYLVTVDCGNDAHEHTNFNNGTNTSFSLINCPMQAGGIKVYVTAQATGYASSVSDTFVYNRTLDALTGVVYNAETDSFVWDAVVGASSYNVTVTVGENTYTFNNGNKTSFSVAGYTGNITVAVTPANAGFNSPAATTATVTKNSPAVPSGITATGSVISWNAAAGATSYEIKIGDITRTTTTNSYDLSDEELTVGNEYAVSVKAINGAESSAYSETVVIGYCKMNPTLTYANNTVYWTPVIGVSTYEVRINGNTDTVVTVENANSAAVRLTKAGVNTIEVRYTNYGGSDWASVEVYAYAVTYMPRNGQSEATEFVAMGDTLTLPRTATYTGYNFTDWYSSPSGAAGNGKVYAAGTQFNEQGNLTLYADWAPVTYNVVLQTEGYDISNVADQTNAPATYTKHYTLPVPTSTNPVYSSFAGWFTGPAGSGDRLTDSEGNSVSPYPFTRDTVAYPAYNTGVLTYTLKPDGTYTVSRGPEFASVAHVQIPSTYNDLPVTVIADNAFASQTSLVTIQIPDTIQLVGTGAFSGCTKLEDITVYEAKPGETYEKFYASYDGALLRYDMGTTYLEVFPRNKTGTYVIPDEVEVIRNKTFQYSYIDKVVIGKGVTTISKYAFYYAYGLDEVEFAEGREASVEFENYAFYGCSQLDTIKLPKTLSTEASELAFVLSYITALETIKVEEGNQYYSTVDGMLTNAEKNTIIYCPTKMTFANDEFIVPNGIRSIGAEAFAGIETISKITIPAFVNNIGSLAFYGCDNVATVDFVGGRNAGNDLNIGDYAFAAMQGLKTVTFNGNDEETLEGGTITLGNNAFSAYEDEGEVTTSLLTVTFEPGVNIEKIGAYAFNNQLYLTYLTFGKDARIASIGDYAFAYNESLKTIEIPATTASVGAYAFAYCSGVSKVEIIEGADNITFGEYAFKDCIKLTSIMLPKTVSQFDGSSFAGCDALRRIEVAEGNEHLKNDEHGILYQVKDGVENVLLFYPKALVIEKGGIIDNIAATVTEISGAIFANNASVKEVTIGKNVVKIGDSAFASCSNLTKVTFEADGTALTIGDYAFEHCFGLEFGANFTLPAYTTSIGKYAFDSCNFTEFTIPAAVTTIGEGAFTGNSKIETIVIPLNVTEIGNAAFSYCDALTTFTIQTPGEGETASALELGSLSASAKEQGVFYMSTNLENVDLGNRVSSIGAYAFYQATALSSIALGDQLTAIGNYAFQNAALTSVTIPTSVTSIGTYAFSATAASYAKLTAKGFKFATGGTNGLEIGTYFIHNQTAITEITLPARLSKIYTTSKVNTYLTWKNIYDSFSTQTALKNIFVEAAPEGTVPHFVSIDGILYETDETGVVTTLLYCPIANEGKDGTLEVIIPKTVTVVERSAFYDVRKITTVTFEEYEKGVDEEYGQPLLTIGCNGAYNSNGTNKYSVFGGETTSSKQKNTITEINLPSHLAYIGNRGISLTKNTLTVNFNPDSTVELGNYAFYYANFTSINIPNVSKAGDAIFNNCKQLTSVNLGGEFDTINKSMFAGCASLTEYTVPANIKYIQNSAFSKCLKLETVTFEEGSKLELIGDWAFSNCLKLKNINLTACPNLNSIGQSTSLTSNGNAFQNCFALETLDLSNCQNLSTIGYASFSNCTSLTSFTFPESVQDIGHNAFNNCYALKTVTLNTTFSPTMLNRVVSNTVKTIFFGCTALEEIIVPEGNPYFTTDEFGALYDVQKTIIYIFPAAADPTGYVIPSTVTEIGAYSFAFFGGDSITIPNGIEKIGNLAFFHNKFTTLNIPASVKTIGSYAFTTDSNQNSAYVKAYASDGSPSTYYSYKDKYTSYLTTVTFEAGNQLESLGGYAFAWANKLTSINLPDSIKTFGTYTFYYCESLPSIIVPAALEIIPNYAFAYNYQIADITLQNGTKAINNYAFYYSGSKSTQEMHLHIPATVETIGTYAFRYCSNMTGLTFDPAGALTSIGTYAFAGAQLERVVFPPNLTNLTSSAFWESSTIKYVEFTGEALTSIPNYTFRNFTALETVILPSGLQSIGNAAFSKTMPSAGGGGGLIVKPGLGGGNDTKQPCISLKSIVIPASVTSIGNYAFAGCTALETVEFEPGSALKNLGESYTEESAIFKDTPALESVLLPDGLEVIGANVFENSAIASINLPSSLTTIGNSAFYNCDNLTRVDIFSNVTYLGDYAFYDCDELVEATPAEIGLEYFGALAFGYCEKLTRAYIPATVSELVGNPYCGCVALTDIELSLDSAFYVKTADGIVYDREYTTIVYYPATASEKNIVLEDSISTIAPGSFAGSSIESITIPARLVEIPDNAFMNCPNLTTVVIENGIKRIGNNAFENCTSLNNVSIPKSASEIGDYAFAGCAALANVTFEETNSKNPYLLGTHIFDGCTAMTAVTLPSDWKITEEDYTDAGYTSYDTATNLGEFIPGYMFANTGIVHAVIPANVTILRTNGVFKNCKNLETVTFEAKRLTNPTLGDYYFYGCSSLKEITIITNWPNDPFGNTKGYAFAYCTSLTKVTYYRASQSGLISILGGVPGNHFEGCTNLKEVKGYEIIIITDDGVDFDYAVTKELSITIDPYMFKDCTSLTSFRFNEKTSIANYAFDGSGLTELSIVPNQLGEGAFANCVNVQNAYIYPYYESSSAYSKFLKGVFAGWTSEQNIYIMTMTRNEFIQHLAKNTAATAASYDELFEGCAANVYFKDEILAMDNITVGTVTSAVRDGLFANLAENQTVTFSLNDYTDIYTKLSATTFGNSKATFYDKNGNVYDYDAETGAVLVKNSEDKVIAVYLYDKNAVPEPEEPAPGIGGGLIKPGLKLANGQLAVTGTEGSESTENAEAIAKLAALGLGTHTDLVLVYLDAFSFSDIATYQKGATTFEAFVGVNATFYDKNGDKFTVDPETGLLKTITVYPTYYTISGGGQLIRPGSSDPTVVGSTLNKLNFKDLGANVTVYIDGQDYNDVIYLKANVPNIFKGCLATVIDCDGNTIEFDEDGYVSRVTNSEDEEVYVRPADEPEEPENPGTGGGDVGGGTGGTLNPGIGGGGVIKPGTGGIIRP